jgi:hypothetical protein
MNCIECSNDLGDKGFGIFTCDQCLTLLKFSAIEGLTLYSKSIGTKSGLTLQEKEERWNNLTPKVGILYDDGINVEATEALNFDPKCISCYNRLESVNNVYGRIIVGSFKVVKQYLETVSLNPLVEVPTMRIYGVPVYKKGWACKSCFDMLYGSTYLNDKLVVMRMFETIELPQVKISDRATTINGAIGRERISRPKVSIVRTGPDGTEDEWPDYRGMATAKPKVEEPVDIKSYGYFMKPKDRRKNILEDDSIIVDERSNWRNK